MSKSRVRIALIGLSPSATTSWASSAHLPNLLTEAGRERFQIVALCNSSVTSAEAAIRAYGLDPATTKAYGSVVELAADPDVDFVLCTTRVDRHYATILPSIRAGKDVFIEWPIAANQQEIEHLVDTAKQSGSSAIVGVQRRYAPPVLKIKELLDAGAIGKLLNVHVNAHGAFISPGSWPIGLKYFAQRAVGGNPITIAVGHLMDAVESAVGDFIPGTAHAHTQLQVPDVPIIDPGTGEVVETIRSDVPDLLSLHGFVTSRTHQEPATLSLHYQGGYPFPGVPALEWTLTGSTGRIRLVDPTGVSFQTDSGPDGVTIQLHRSGADTAQDIDWQYSDLQKEVPLTARTMQTLLYGYADGKRGLNVGVGGDTRLGRDWPTIESAAARAAQIDEWLRTFK